MESMSTQTHAFVARAAPRFFVSYDATGLEKRLAQSACVMIPALAIAVLADLADLADGIAPCSTWIGSGIGEARERDYRFNAATFGNEGRAHVALTVCASKQEAGNVLPF
jgi:hypothetical protein